MPAARERERKDSSQRKEVSSGRTSGRVVCERQETTALRSLHERETESESDPGQGAHGRSPIPPDPARNFLNPRMVLVSDATALACSNVEDRVVQFGSAASKRRRSGCAHRKAKYATKTTHDPRMSTCDRQRQLAYERLLESTHMVCSGRAASWIKGQRRMQDFVRNDLDACRVVQRSLRA